MAEHSQSAICDEFSRLSADLLDQSMEKIRHCLKQVHDDQVWWRPRPSMNSIGNLLLHLAGNLNQWGVVPFTLGTDRRDRDSEFQTDARLPGNQLLERLESVVANAKEQWKYLAAGQLLRQVTIQGFQVTHMHAIEHAASHFVGHAHQIVQLTRMQLGPDYRFHWTPDQDHDDLPI